MKYSFALVFLLAGCMNGETCRTAISGFRSYEPFHFSNEELNGVYAIAKESFLDLPDSLKGKFQPGSLSVVIAGNEIAISAQLKKMRYDEIFSDLITTKDLTGTWEQVQDNTKKQAGILVKYLDNNQKLMFIEGFSIISTVTDIPVIAINTPWASDKYCGKILLVKQH